jgi:hypothetical protein
MNEIEIEELLCAAYREAADTVHGEAVRALVAPPLTRRMRRMRRRGRLTSFAPLAAAVAVVIVVAAALAVPRLLPSGGVPRTQVTAPSGTPPFLVQLPYTGSGSAPLVVQAAGTRHVTGTVPAPPHTTWRAVAATGSDRTFVVAATDLTSCRTRIYSLTVTAAGAPARLAPFGSAIAGGLTSDDSLTASANGQVVAYGLTNCLPRVSTGVIFDSIGLMHADGTATSWDLPSSSSIGSLSLSGNGEMILFEYIDLLPAGSAPGSSAQTSAVRLLAAGSPGSPSGNAVTSSRLIVTGQGATSPASAAISSDGTTLYITLRLGTGPRTAITLVEYGIDGTPGRTLHTWSGVTGEYPAAMTQGGDKLLVWGIYQPGTFEVDLATRKTTPFWMYTPDGEFPESVAW